MPAFQYNPDNQKKFTPQANEPFLKNVPKDRVFVPTPGIQHRLRFLPPWSSTGLFARFARTHWRVGGQGKAFACPDMWEEGTCPFCRAWAQIRPQYDLYQQDVLAIRPTPRYYSNIINVVEPAKGVQVYTYGKRVYQMIKGIQDSGSFGDITDAINGCDLILQRTGAGIQVQDVVYPVPQHSPIQNPDWLDQLFNLDDIFNRPDLEEVEVCFKTQPWRVYNPNGPVGAAAANYPTSPPTIPPPPAGWAFPPPGAQRFTPPSGAPILTPIPPAVQAPVYIPPVAANADTSAAAAPSQPMAIPAATTMENIQSLEDKIRAKLNAAKPA